MGTRCWIFVQVSRTKYFACSSAGLVLSVLIRHHSLLLCYFRWHAPDPPPIPLSFFRKRTTTQMSRSRTELHPVIIRLGWTCFIWRISRLITQIADASHLSCRTDCRKHLSQPPILHPGCILVGRKRKQTNLGIWPSPPHASCDRHWREQRGRCDLHIDRRWRNTEEECLYLFSQEEINQSRFLC